MIMVGAGPAGISMAAEARNVGVSTDQILVQEKGETLAGDSEILPGVQRFPANSRGIEAVCAGVMVSRRSIS